MVLYWVFAVVSTPTACSGTGEKSARQARLEKRERLESLPERLESESVERKDGELGEKQTE